MAAFSGLGLLFASGALDSLVRQLRSLTEPPAVAPSEGPGPPEAVQPAAAERAEWASGASATVQAAPQHPSLPNPTALNNEAVQALEEGDLDRAIKLLAEAVTARPDDKTFADNLGEAYLRRARAADQDGGAAALVDYDLALQFTTDETRRSQISGLRDKARAIAETEAEFVVEPTLHFTFKFDGSREEILDGIEQLKVLLEDTYLEYGDLFGHRPVEAGEPRIAVVLYRAAGFDRVTGLGDWAGGVFDGTIRVPAEDLTDARRVARLRDVLRHELSHAFTQSIGGADVPAWLNEGLAQWLESPSRRADAVKFSRARLAAAISTGGRELFPLTTLTGSLVAWKDKSEITRAYDQALAFTDYLARQYGTDILFEMAAACADEGGGAAEAHFRSKLLVDLSLVLGDFGDSLE